MAVNGKPVGTIRPVSTNALRYNTDRGVWHEYAQPFDAALLKGGENEMKLTVPAGKSPPASVTTTCDWNSTADAAWVKSAVAAWQAQSGGAGSTGATTPSKRKMHSLILIERQVEFQ